MKKCWDEKFEKRPEFSSLVHSMGNMLTESFRKVCDHTDNVDLYSNIVHKDMYLMLDGGRLGIGS